jgi:predicted CXXCH cytochrome family protein
MKKTIVFSLLIVGVLIGCARTWESPSLEKYRPASSVPPASVCQSCHQSQYDAWKENRHSSEERMVRIAVEELRECEACHTGTTSHAQNPQANVPPKIDKLSKTEQNTLCGKCHYSQKLFGSHAINPHDKHGLFASVGFEGHQQQLSCLDCHSGHQGKSEMLVSIKAHLCYKCHKRAIVTMGIFQPFSYLSFGKACQACHSVHGGSSGAKWARMGTGVCVVCHFVGVAIVD